jgi:hypothetical protein
VGFLINREGLYQAVDPGLGELMEPAVFMFPSGEKEADVTANSFQGNPCWRLYLAEGSSLVPGDAQPMDVGFKEMYASATP